jgi:hypothetical protein
VGSRKPWALWAGTVILVVSILGRFKVSTLMIPKSSVKESVVEFLITTLLPPGASPVVLYTGSKAA